MAEQVKNFGTTVLSGGIDASTATVVVLDGSVFPASGNFRVVVDSEIMLCTSRTGNTLTVTRGAESSTAASHLDAAPIAHILTAGSLLTYIQEQSIQTVVAGRGVSVDVSSPKNPIVNMNGIIPAASGGTGKDFTSGSGIPNFVNGVSTLLQLNLSATAAPTTSSDGTEGYAVGSIWVDTTNDNVYQATDVSTGAAIWRRLDGVVSVSAGSGIHIDNTNARQPVIHSTVVANGWNVGILPQESGGTGSNLVNSGSGVIFSRGNGISEIRYSPRNAINAIIQPGFGHDVTWDYAPLSMIHVSNPTDLHESGVYICLGNDPNNARWRRIDNLTSYGTGSANEFNILPGYDQDNGYTYGSTYIGYDLNAYICVAPSTSSSYWRKITSDVNNIYVKPSGGIVLTQLNQQSGTWSLAFNPNQTVPVANDPYSMLHGSFIGIGTLDHNRIRGVNPLSVLGESGSASGTGSIDVMSAANDHEVLRRKANVLGFGKITGSGIEDNSIEISHLAKSSNSDPTVIIREDGGNNVSFMEVPATTNLTYLGRNQNNGLGFDFIQGSGIYDGSIPSSKMVSQAAGTLFGRTSATAGSPAALTPQSGVIVDSTNVMLGIPGICGMRLTLVPNTPYLASGVTSSTVYLTPTGKEFSGMVSTYDGSKWLTKSYPQTSVSLTSTASGTNFDFFFYDNNGTGLLEKVNWTNDTTRATALIRQDGVYVKSGVSSGLFVGTGRTGAADTTEFTPFSTAAPVRCFLTNHYNKKQVSFRKRENVASWTYNSNTPRPLNNNSRNRFEFVVPMTEDQVDSIGMVTQGNQNTGKVGFCLNATNRYDIGYKHSLWPAATTINGLAIGRMITFPSGGFNFIQMLESSDSSVTMTFWSDTVTEGGMVSDFYC